MAVREGRGTQGQPQPRAAQGQLSPDLHVLFSRPGAQHCFLGQEPHPQEPSAIVQLPLQPMFPTCPRAMGQIVVMGLEQEGQPRGSPSSELPRGS